MVADMQVGRGRELRRPAVDRREGKDSRLVVDVKDSCRRPREIAAGPARSRLV